MDTTVLASGQASQFWGVVTVPKTRKQNKDRKQQQEKANKPNDKQNPQRAKQAL